MKKTKEEFQGNYRDRFKETREADILYTVFFFLLNCKTRILLGAENRALQRQSRVSLKEMVSTLAWSKTGNVYKSELYHFHNGRLILHVLSQISFVSHARMMRLPLSAHLYKFNRTTLQLKPLVFYFTFESQELFYILSIVWHSVVTVAKRPNFATIVFTL